MALGALTVGACSLGEKSEQAEQIQRSLAVIADLDVVATIRASVSAEARVVEALAAGGGRDDGRPDANADPTADDRTVSVLAEIEPGAGRASLVVEGHDTPASIFLLDVVFVHRQNARETERRRWAEVDLSTVRFDRELGLDEMDSGSLAHALMTTVNPSFFLDLVAGVLAGSIEVTGEERIDGVPTTAYEFNLSLDKALTDIGLDDSRRLIRVGLLRQFGITKDVVPGAAWLDGDGALRRFRVEMPMKVTPVDTRVLDLTIDLTPAPHDVFVTAPDPDVVVTYETLGRLLRAAMPEGS